MNPFSQNNEDNPPKNEAFDLNAKNETYEYSASSYRKLNNLGYKKNTKNYYQNSERPPNNSTTFNAAQHFNCRFTFF